MMMRILYKLRLQTLKQSTAFHQWYKSLQGLLIFVRSKQMAASAVGAAINTVNWGEVFLGTMPPLSLYRANNVINEKSQCITFLVMHWLDIQPIKWCFGTRKNNQEVLGFMTATMITATSHTANPPMMANRRLSESFTNVT